MHIFREFEKNNDKFIATNHFFISNENEFGKIEFSIFDMVNKKNIIHSENINNENANLVIISNISFSLNDIKINKSYIINKFIENDAIMDDDIIEDLYYNNDFSKKININLPDKYMNTNTQKKYLFKINMTEINQSFYQENNKLVLSA